MRTAETSPFLAPSCGQPGTLQVRRRRIQSTRKRLLKGSKTPKTGVNGAGGPNGGAKGIECYESRGGRGGGREAEMGQFLLENLKGKVRAQQSFLKKGL